MAREVEVNLQSGAKRQIKLNADGAGNWTDETGKSLPEFTGCFEIDISATPFTNTLPIRRARLETGESVDRICWRMIGTAVKRRVPSEIHPIGTANTKAD